MAFATSSLLGADFTQSNATALFTTNQVALGSDGSEWVYIKATGTLATGALVAIRPDGTAIAATTAILCTPDVAEGFSLAFTQFQIAQGSFGFAARKGHNMVVRCSGTVANLNVLYLANTPGALSTAMSSATLAGIYITTSASTASLTMSGRAILNYPRVWGALNTPLG